VPSSASTHLQVTIWGSFKRRTSSDDGFTFSRPQSSAGLLHYSGSNMRAARPCEAAVAATTTALLCCRASLYQRRRPSCSRIQRRSARGRSIVGGLIIACPSNGESRETTEAAVMSTLILKRASASRSSGQWRMVTKRAPPGHLPDDHADRAAHLRRECRITPCLVSRN
jgi:hypothetical protein